MPKLIRDNKTEPAPLPHHEDWKRNPLKAVFGSVTVSGSLFSLFTLLSWIASTHPEIVRTDTTSLVFPVINLLAFALWFFVSRIVLHKLGWQAPAISIFALIIGVVIAAYNITSIGQTLVTYPVGIFLGICILLIYYFLYNSRMILWIGLPVLLLFIVGIQINQRDLDNNATKMNAAENLATVFTFPIYFTDTIPANKYLVQHFYWDTARQNIRFVMQGNIAINENYIFDSQQSPPLKCGLSACVDLGEIKKGQHIYTDKDNQYLVEYYVMFDNTLVRLSSSKEAPLSKEEAKIYLQDFIVTTPDALLRNFNHDYLLTNSYYFIPKQIFNKDRADFSVVGETNF